MRTDQQSVCIKWYVCCTVDKAIKQSRRKRDGWAEGVATMSSDEERERKKRSEREGDLYK